MPAMVFSGPATRLVRTEVAPPRPSEPQVLIRVSACAACRTDLHIIDSELADPKLPLIPGHEIVGAVIGKGARVDRFALGIELAYRLGWTCGICDFCRARRRICVTALDSLATGSMAGLPSRRSRISASALPFPPRMATSRPHRSCVPD